METQGDSDNTKDSLQGAIEGFKQQLNNYRDRLTHLGTQNQFLQAILSTLPQSILITDSNGKISFTNASASDQIGLSPDQLNGSDILEFIHPTDWNRLRVLLHHPDKESNYVNELIHIRCVNGSYENYLLQVCPFNSYDAIQPPLELTKDSKAQPTDDKPHQSNGSDSDLPPPFPKSPQWLIILNPVDQYRNYNFSVSEVRKNSSIPHPNFLTGEEFLNAILENLSDGIVVCDAEGNLTLINRATQEFHNLPAKPIPAEQWAEYYSLYKSDGKTPMPLEEIPLYQALQGEAVRDLEMTIVPKAGTPRTILVSGDAITSPDGKTLGAVVAMKDISRRKEAEAALKALNAELETRVFERTRALEQEVENRKRIEKRLIEQNHILITQNQKLELQRRKIQQQNIQLTEASRLKSRFLAMMSHELRTPMNAIIGFSQLILRQRKTPLPPKTEEMVRRILNNGKKLLTMVNELLDFSKAEAGKLDIKPQHCDIGKVVKNTVDELRSLAVEKKIDLRYSINVSNTYLVNDPVRLRQILVNLVSNAIKFTEKGYVHISINQATQEHQEGALNHLGNESPSNTSPSFSIDERIVICVEDTGIGIDSDMMDTIFEPFQQLDQSNARRYQGTGLGLAIVKALVLMMQGRIHVNSKLGNGSTFCIEIPRRIHAVEC